MLSSYLQFKPKPPISIPKMGLVTGPLCSSSNVAMVIKSPLDAFHYDLPMSLATEEDRRACLWGLLKLVTDLGREVPEVQGLHPQRQMSICPAWEAKFPGLKQSVAEFLPCAEGQRKTSFCRGKLTEHPECLGARQCHQDRKKKL